MDLGNCVLPYTLFREQAEFINSSKRFIMMDGGVRSGKTYALAGRAHRLAFMKPGSKGIIGAFTLPMIKRTIWREFIEMAELMYPKKIWTVNKSDMVFTLKLPGHKPSIIDFVHLENEGRIRGMTLDWACVDEITVDIKEDTFSQLLNRLSNEGATFATTTNPGTTSHWAYKFFFEPIEKNRPKIHHIHVTPYHNPFLNREYVEDLETRSEYWKNRFLWGRWGAVEGLVYSEFERRKHVADFDHLTLKEIFNDPDDAPPIYRDLDVWMGIDWGMTTPTAAVVMGFDNDRRCYLLDEYYQAGKTPTQNAPMLLELAKKYNARKVVYDNNWPAAAVDVRTHWKECGYPADTWRAAVKTPKSVMAGINKIKDGFRVAKDGIPRIMIHHRCANTIREFESYEWAKNNDGLKDEPKKLNDHALDACRYVYSIVMDQ